MDKKLIKKLVQDFERRNERPVSQEENDHIRKARELCSQGVLDDFEKSVFLATEKLRTNGVNITPYNVAQLIGRQGYEVKNAMINIARKVECC